MMCHLVFEVAIHGHPDELMPPLVGGVGGTPIALILLVGAGDYHRSRTIAPRAYYAAWGSPPPLLCLSSSSRARRWEGYSETTGNCQVAIETRMGKGGALTASEIEAARRCIM
jgi:hypothetical protein